MTEVSVYHHTSPFPLKRGGTLSGFELAWESWGTLNTASDNALLIFTGLSPSAHAASNHINPEPGWWEFMIGPGKPIDTKRWYVICVNSLGSCKGSTGPASINPDTGEIYADDFPELSLEDVAASTKLLLDHLKLDRLAAVIGPSMGGMSAQAFCVMFPGVTDNLISVSSAPHAFPFAIAIRSLQREAIRSDPNYRNGRYHGHSYPVQGMRMARKLGMISYRSAEEWRGRFGRTDIPPERRQDTPFSAEFEIESYLEAHAERFIHSFDPNCYLYLSRAMDWFDIASHAQCLAEAYEKMYLRKALVIGVDTDILFPSWQQQQIAKGIQACGADVEFHALPSLQGHDAFLVDEERFAPLIREFMAKL